MQAVQKKIPIAAGGPEGGETDGYSRMPMR